MLPVVSAAAQKLSEKSVAYTYDEKTSIEYSLTYTGFKEDIVVSEYTGQTEYDFTLCTGGLKLVEKNGSYVLTDNDGTQGLVIIDNGEAPGSDVIIRPIIHIMHIKNNTALSIADQDQLKLACMATTFLHETAHVFGLDEQYEAYSHDVLGDTVCAMERYEEIGEVRFYLDAKQGIKKAFCNYCTTYMEIYTSNINIDGNQEG